MDFNAGMMPPPTIMPIGNDNLPPPSPYHLDFTTAGEPSASPQMAPPPFPAKPIFNPGGVNPELPSITLSAPPAHPLPPFPSQSPGPSQDNYSSAAGPFAHSLPFRPARISNQTQTSVQTNPPSEDISEPKHKSWSQIQRQIRNEKRRADKLRKRIEKNLSYELNNLTFSNPLEKEEDASLKAADTISTLPPLSHQNQQQQGSQQQQAPNHRRMRLRSGTTIQRQKTNVAGRVGKPQQKSKKPSRTEWMPPAERKKEEKIAAEEQRKARKARADARVEARKHEDCRVLGAEGAEKVWALEAQLNRDQQELSKTRRRFRKEMLHKGKADPDGDDTSEQVKVEAPDEGCAMEQGEDVVKMEVDT